MATDWDVFLGEHKLFGFQKRERFYREHPELIRREKQLYENLEKSGK